MKLYLAGPLFTTAERTWNAEVTAALRAAGHEVILPQDQEPGRDGPGIFVTDVGGIDWADGLVAMMDGADPDSGTCWEVGYAYAMKKSIVLVRTDIRLSGSVGDYNPMLTQAATVRIDLRGASTMEVIGAILVALERMRRTGDSLRTVRHRTHRRGTGLVHDRPVNRACPLRLPHIKRGRRR